MSNSDSPDDIALPPSWCHYVTHVLMLLFMVQLSRHLKEKEVQVAKS